MNELWKVVRNPLISALMILILPIALTVGCEKHISQVVIQLPAGFTGQVQVEMGVQRAPALPTQANAYIISLPGDGHVKTSTIIPDNLPYRFENSSHQVWGYAVSIARTGDGIPVRGTIDFFVGSKEQYEAQEARKNKSELKPEKTFYVQ